MRTSEFLAWRKSLRLTQQSAAKELGVSRATIQNWEKEVTSIPPMVQLSCNVLRRRWRKRDDYGPVLLIQASGALSLEDGRTTCEMAIHCELFANNGAAFDRLVVTGMGRDSVFLLACDGGVAHSWREILQEVKRRKRKTNNRTAVSSPPQSGPSTAVAPNRRLRSTSDFMDIWEFKKWRRGSRLSQVEAAKALGVSRGAIQHWECERSPIPRAAALACEEIASRRRLVDGGPLVIVQITELLWPESEEVSLTCYAQCELLASGDLIARRVLDIRKASHCSAFVIMDSHGDAICDATDSFCFEPHEESHG